MPELGAAMRTQADELRRLAPPARLGDPESVHDMRVATRRLRSILRATRRMLDPDWVLFVRGELAWVGDLLGAVRELDVLGATLSEDASMLSGGDAVVAPSLLQPLGVERAAALGQMAEGLESTRFERLLVTLESASAEPPWNGREQRLERVAAKEFRRLRKRARLNPEASNAALHKGRIRVKRARYAAELAVDARGKRAAKFISAAKNLQDLLGEHQDAVIARRRLRDLSLASKRPDTSLAAGRLIERQEQRMHDARKRLPASWKRLEKRGRRAW
jgi:CHAD domain-containing protein